MTKHEDRDLPGDRGFRPAPAIVEATVNTPTGPAAAMAMTLSPIEQANIHHNQLRYNELAKLRNGQPSLYERTSYRH